MNIKQNEDLTDYSTMRLGGKASFLVVVHTKDELKSAVDHARKNNLMIRMIGEGSNIVFSDKGFDGLIIINHIFGISVKHDDESSSTIEFGGGIKWDDAVAYSVVLNLSGIEALSLIPGTVGAGPVQNIGAYGQQLSDSLVEVEAYDLEEDGFTTLSADDLKLGYRTSILKNVKQQRYLVTSVTLKLQKSSTITDLYSDVAGYFKEHGIEEISPHSIRTAVVAIRENKLPDPRAIANTGSFFANPIVDVSVYRELADKHPEIDQTPQGWPQPPRWISQDGSVKISAGWLVSEAGFKDHHDPETGMATWPKQALVLINEHAKSPNDLFAYRDKIIDAVQKKFGITLEQEPETI